MKKEQDDIEDQNGEGESASATSTASGGTMASDKIKKEPAIKR